MELGIGKKGSEGSTGFESVQDSCFRLVSSTDDEALGEIGSTLADSALDGGEGFIGVDDCSTTGTGC